ncbi:MAG: hypothetical protein M3Y74_02980 [Chloroflexota bacterium]|nr:hypothetical protein [Chloroflexota bacterium]
MTVGARLLEEERTLWGEQRQQGHIARHHTPPVAAHALDGAKALGGTGTA